MTIKIASGFLPIARDTKNVCLAWRSPKIRQGDCWGMIGGMVKDNLSILDGALLEMGEEVGYYGAVEAHQAFVMRRVGFEYHNFIGIVPSEFPFNPEPEFAYETSFISWMPYEEVRRLVTTQSHNFHPGLLEFLRESDALIRRFIYET